MKAAAGKRTFLPFVKPLLVVLALCSLASCSKKEAPRPSEGSGPAAQAAGNSPPPSSPAAQPKAVPPVPMKPTVPPKGAAGKEQAPAPKPQAVMAKDDPLFGAPGIAIPASDFTLGALQSSFRGGPREREVFVLFSGFLDAFRSGGDVSKFLHPAYREFLMLVMEAAKKDGRTFEAFRIGAVREGRGGVFEAGVLLLGKEGRTTGKILAEKGDSSLLVSGLIVDFAGLGVRFEREDSEPFLPVGNDSPFK